MNRTGTIVLICGVVGIAVAAAVFALSGSGDSPTPARATSGAQTGTAPTDDGSTPETPAPRAGRKRRVAAAGVPADLVAVAGVVTDEQGRPIEGARVVCHVVPEGSPSDEVRVMRSMLGDMLDDKELTALAEQSGLRMSSDGKSGTTARGSARFGFGMGRGGASGTAGASGGSEEEAEAAMRTGMQIGRRMMSEPGRMSRAMRGIQLMTAGFEDDAPYPAIDDAVTDAKGQFRFEALPENGEFELRATAARHQRAKTRAKVGNVKVSMALGAASVVSGEVRSAGQALAGALVRFRTHVVTTGGDGKFVFDGARGPREPIQVTAPGHTSAGIYVKVPATGDAAPVVIELFPAGTVRGRVTSSDGAPIRGAEVVVAREGMGMFAMMMPGAGGDKLPPTDPSATTGADGSYTLEGLPSGKVKLRASRTGYLDQTGGPYSVLPGDVLDGVDFVLPKESALAGRVTDSAGAPVADATVGVSSPAEGMMKMAAQFMGGSWKTARTDSDGRYRVGGSVEGPHDVYVEAPGYLKQTDKITLPAGADATKDFTLPPGHEVTGIVLDPSGQPVASASVRLASTGGGGGNPMAAMMGALTGAAGRATTGTDGKFAAKGLPEGPYTVTARATGFLDGTLDGVAAGATDVTLSLGAAATISGRLKSLADGAPLSGTVYYKTKNAATRGGNPFAAMMRTDQSVAAGADGTFTITGIPGGAYELYARSAGYAETAKTKVEVSGGATVGDLELVLPPGASLSGSVTRKGSGAPVEGALVYVSLDANPMAAAMALLETEPTAPAGSASAKTDASGRFTIEGLTPGTVVLEVRGKGFAPLSLGNTAAPAANVVCELSEGGSVEGIAYAKGGYPLEGATIMLQRGMMGQGLGGTATTDREGRFKIERLPPASYQAILIDPESTMGMGGMKNVTVRDGEMSELVFGQKGAGRSVSGDVIRGGKPLADATVSLFGGSGGMQLSTSDPSGRFKFEGLEPGSYTVTVQTQMMGGGSATTKVTVPADGDPAAIRLEISVLSVDGMVVDSETGAPVALAQVVLMKRGGTRGNSLADVIGRQSGQAFTGTDGHFTMEGVQDGVFDLRATANGYAEAELEGVQAGSRGVRVAMSKGVEFAVTVLGPDEKPVVGAMVVPADASGREGIPFDMTATKQTGQDGVARMRLQSGRYTMRVRSGAYPEASVSVDAGQSAVTVRLEDGGAIEVLAKTSGGQPVAGAKVTLLDSAGAEITASFSMGNLFGSGDATDAAGRAVREGLRAGRVSVVVRSALGAETRSSATITSGSVTKVEVVLD